MDKLTENYEATSTMKEALEIAILYCEEHIPTTDAFSKKKLETLLGQFEYLRGKMDWYDERIVAATQNR